MQEKLNLLRCNICKNIVEILAAGEGEPVCCNKIMEKLEDVEITKDDPHYANIEILENEQKRIYFNHKMTPEHRIEFAEVISNDKKYVKRKYFEVNETPEIILKCDCKEGFYVRTYCNIHNVCLTKYEG